MTASGNNTQVLWDVIKYIVLLCMSAAFGLVIEKQSSSTIVLGLISLFVVILLCRAMEIPFYLSVLALILVQEVEVTPGSFLSYVQNYKMAGVPSLLEICLFIFCICFLLKYVMQKESRYVSFLRPPLALFLICYGMALYLGISQVNNDILVKEDAKKFILPIAYFFACMNILDSREKAKRLVVLVSLSTMMKLMLGIFSYLRGAGFEYGTSQVVFLETADLLVVVTVSVALIAFLVYQPITTRRIVFSLVLGAPLIFALIYSNRRNAWLGIILALVMLFALTPSRTKVRFFAVLATVSMAALIMVGISMSIHGVPSTDVLISRFASISDKTDKSNEAHVNEWVVTIEALREHPLLGLGFGSEHAPVPGDDTINRHTVHNAFLMLYMKMGLFSVVLFGWGLVRYLQMGVRNYLAVRDRVRDPLTIGLLSTFAYWMVTLNVAPSWWYYRETCLMALVAAIVVKSPSLRDGNLNGSSEVAEADL